MSLESGRAAAALGGRPELGHASCIAIDHVWDGSHWHGLRQVHLFAPAGSEPIALIEPRLPPDSRWWERIVFFDLETTGLSGGAGTLPFLAGCGWFEEGAFRVRQFFLAAPSAEQAMLDALGRMFDEASLLVTFNGRTFDVPLMDTRWAFHRRESAAEHVPHLDMLPVSRRLWGRREARQSAERASCTLSSLERAVLGFHRIGDVPGLEIPIRYFHFLRTGDAAAIAGVLEHNRHDLLSLAGVLSRALWLAQDGPAACRDAGEQMGVGRLYERAGDLERAAEAFEHAARAADRQIQPYALARLAMVCRRLQRHAESATAWRELWDLGRRSRVVPEALRLQAAEALAIHHEHRARDLPVAREYAEALERRADPRTRPRAAHRLDRIDRKLGKTGPLL
jgi:uncharacterized protein YprB with RNaseH-like and TPR domain